MLKTGLLILALILPASAMAEANAPWWQFWRNPDTAVQTASLLFSDEERRLILDYYSGNDDRGDWSGRDKPKKQKSLPPGLRKKLERGGELPPGWQKKVARGEVLDDDLYRYSRRLPDELLGRVSRHGTNTDVRILDDRVIRIMDGTRAVLDILELNRASGQ